MTFFFFALPISAALGFKIFSNAALRAKSLPTPDLEYLQVYFFLESRTNRQITPRFPLKAQTTNSQRESLRVKGLRSNHNKKSKKFRLIFQPPKM